MSIVSVDLASVYSGSIILDDDGKVIDQTDSWQLNEDEFLDWITLPWKFDVGIPDVLVIEDLPFKLPFMKITKKVCQLQGRIEEKMFQYGYRDKILYVAPAVWLRSYGIKTAKDSAKLVEPKAKEFGFVSPIDYTVFHGKDRQIAKKVSGDYAAAFLIGLWALNYHKEHGTYDSPQTSRVV